MAEQRSDTFQVTDPGQLEAVASAQRQDILARLAAYGPLSVRELAKHVGARPSALYHHIQKLIDIGLVVEAGTRTRRRRREQLYNALAPRMRLTEALADKGKAELIAEIAVAQSRQMMRDFRAGLRSSSAVSQGQFRNQTFFRLVGRPTRAQLARINACILEITETLFQSNDPDGKLIALSLVMSPLDRAADGDSEPS